MNRAPILDRVPREGASFLPLAFRARREGAFPSTTVLLLGAFACSAPAPAPGSGRNGRITYATSGGELHVFDLAARADAKVLAGTEPDRFPTGEIAFVDSTGAPKRISKARADGVGTATLLDAGSTVTDCNPVVSPDGAKIAFTYYPGRFAHSLAPSDGTVVIDASSKVVASFPGVFDPAWTPDGRLVLAGTVEIRNDAGSGETRVSPVRAGLFITDAALHAAEPFLVAGTRRPEQPAVSPDGTRIAFMDEDHLYAVGISGGQAKQLTQGDHKDSHPAFSPDGSEIAFHSFGDHGASTPYPAIAIIRSSEESPVTLDEGSAAYLLDPGRTATASSGRISAVSHMAWRAK